MIIAYVLGEFPVVSETFISREITALRAMGVRVVVFALRGPGSALPRPDVATLPDEVRFRAAVSGRQILRSFAWFARNTPRRLAAVIRRVVWNAVRCPHVHVKTLRNLPAALAFAREAAQTGVGHIHAHFAFTPADVAGIMADLLDKPFSVSVHARDIYTQSGRRIAQRVGRAAFVAACTDHGLQHLRRTTPGLEAARTVLVRHGLRLDDFRPGQPRDGLILAVGRLEEKKGFVYLVRACALLRAKGKSFRCVLVGSGSEQRRLRQEIEARGLSGHVAMRGETDQKALAALYGEASIFVAPSVVARDGDRDGLPNVLIEAMAMRLPVVSTAVGGIPELVKDGANGFLAPPGDVAALADRLERLLGDHALREQMGANGRAEVERRFDISRNILDLIQLFARSCS